jgi:predicted ATPase
MGLEVWPSSLAEAYAQVGQADEGLSILDEALGPAHTHEERHHEAELHRLEGGLLLMRAMAPHAEAEAYFQQALNVARRPQAKSLELRAAMSLARLWRQQGKRREASRLLAEVYGWFTEGFDTADVKEAKALLDVLSEYGAVDQPLPELCQRLGHDLLADPGRVAPGQAQ